MFAKKEFIPPKIEITNFQAKISLQQAATPDGMILMKHQMINKNNF